VTIMLITATLVSIDITPYSIIVNILYQNSDGSKDPSTSKDSCP